VGPCAGFAVAVLGLAAACVEPDAGAADRAPLSLGERRELEAAEAVVAADLDGDGIDSLILVRDGVARWGGRQADLGGAVQVTARGDIDGDGLEEALVATGMARAHRQAPARLWSLDEQDAKLLWERKGERNQVTDLRVLGGRIWLVRFDDDRQSTGGWLLDGDPRQLEVAAKGALATRQLPLDDGGVLVARIYGDEPRSDGDLQLRRADGSRRGIPSLRGVRSLELAELDGQEAPELLVGDGWHYAYGERALARLRLLQGEEWQRGRTIAVFDDEYSVRQLEVAGRGSDARILALGSAKAHLLVRDGLGWADLVLGEVGETGNAVFARLAEGEGVAISGDPASWIALER